MSMRRRNWGGTDTDEKDEGGEVPGRFKRASTAAVKAQGNFLLQTFQAQIKLGDAVTIFREHDKDKNGFLDRKEFQSALSHSGYNLTKQELNLLFQAFDADSNEQISLKEFKVVVKTQNYWRGVRNQLLSCVSFASVVLFWAAITNLFGGLPVELIKMKLITDQGLDENNDKGFLRARLIELVLGCVYFFGCVAVMIIGNVDYSGASFSEDEDEDEDEDDETNETNDSKSSKWVLALFHRRFHLDRWVKFNAVGFLGAVAWLGADLIFDAIVAWTCGDSKDISWFALNVSFLVIANILLVLTGTMSQQFSAGDWDSEQHVCERTKSAAAYGGE